MMRCSTTSLPGCIVLDQPALISDFIARLQNSHAVFAVPLYRAALAGELSVVQLAPGGRVPVWLLDHTRPATVVVVSGDPPDGTPAAPPDAFPQARRLLAWAASAMVHATGGQELHYRAVVVAARATRRVLLIETATSQETAWTVLLEAERTRRREVGRHLPGLVLSARVRGGVHPVGSPVSASGVAQ